MVSTRLAHGDEPALLQSRESYRRGGTTGTITRITPHASTFSSASGPVILAGDGVKSITGAVLDSPVAAAIVGSSVSVLPATAQALIEESTYIKGGWFSSSKTIKTQRHTSTPVGTKITAPRAIVGTTDAAGTARLHMIDAALQAAYDRGAAPAELKPLWQQRNDALRGLILVAQNDEVTRI